MVKPTVIKIDHCTEEIAIKKRARLKPKGFLFNEVIRRMATFIADTDQGPTACSANVSQGSRGGEGEEGQLICFRAEFGNTYFCGENNRQQIYEIKFVAQSESNQSQLFI